MKIGNESAFVTLYLSIMGAPTMRNGEWANRRTGAQHFILVLVVVVLVLEKAILP